MRVILEEILAKNDRTICFFKLKCDFQMGGDKMDKFERAYKELIFNEIGMIEEDDIAYKPLLHILLNNNKATPELVKSACRQLRECVDFRTNSVFKVHEDGSYLLKYNVWDDTVLEITDQNINDFDHVDYLKENINFLLNGVTEQEFFERALGGEILIPVY